MSEPIATDPPIPPDPPGWDKPYPKALWDLFNQQLDAETDSWVAEMADHVRKYDADQASGQKLQAILENFTDEEKFNPYHDERGQFTSEGGGTFVSLWGKPSDTGRVVGRGSDLPSERSSGPMRSHAELKARLDELDKEVAGHADNIRAAEDRAQAALKGYQAVDKEWSLASRRVDEANYQAKRAQENANGARDAGAAPHIIEGLQEHADNMKAEQTDALKALNDLRPQTAAAAKELDASRDNVTTVRQAAADSAAHAASAREGLNDELRQTMVNDGFNRLADMATRSQANQAEYDKFGSSYQQAADQWTAARDARGQAEGKLEDLQKWVEPNDPEIAQRQADLNKADAAFKDAKANLDKQSAAWDDASTKFWATQHAIQQERSDLNDTMRKQYINAPEGPAKTAIGTDMQPSQIPQTWRNGLQASNEISGKGAVDQAEHPSVPMRLMDPSDPGYKDGRSYCSGTYGGITMHPSESPSTSDGAVTTVHEMGHWIEASVPGATPRIQEHIASRTAGEQPQSLRTLTGMNYHPNEMTKPDKFADPYMGKDYGGHASEFLSMSMQKMYQDPIGFARTDPQSYNFTMGLLQEARAGGGRIGGASEP